MKSIHSLYHCLLKRGSRITLSPETKFPATEQGPRADLPVQSSYFLSNQHEHATSPPALVELSFLLLRLLDDLQQHLLLDFSTRANRRLTAGPPRFRPAPRRRIEFRLDNHIVNIRVIDRKDIVNTLDANPSRRPRPKPHGIIRQDPVELIGRDPLGNSPRMRIGTEIDHWSAVRPDDAQGGGRSAVEHAVRHAGKCRRTGSRRHGPQRGQRQDDIGKLPLELQCPQLVAGCPQRSRLRRHVEEGVHRLHRVQHRRTQPLHALPELASQAARPAVLRLALEAVVPAPVAPVGYADLVQGLSRRTDAGAVAQIGCKIVRLEALRYAVCPTPSGSRCCGSWHCP